MPDLHARDLMRPDTLDRVPRETHAVAAAVAKFGSLLCQKNHTWNKSERALYRRAMRSVAHPCCPNCAKPMAESVQTVEDRVHKSWYCAVCQNL